MLSDEHIGIEARQVAVCSEPVCLYVHYLEKVLNLLEARTKDKQVNVSKSR